MINNLYYNLFYNIIYMINIFTRIKIYIQQLFNEPLTTTGGKRVNWLYYYRPIV